MTTDNRNRAWLQRFLTAKKDFGPYQGLFEPSFEEIRAAFEMLQQSHELAAQVIDLYYCITQDTQHTYATIGTKIGRSESGAQQLSVRGIRRLRFYLSRRLYTHICADVRRYDEEFASLKVKIAQLERQLKGVEKQKTDVPLMDTIASLKLSPRTQQHLRTAGIEMVSDLIAVGPKYLLSLRNFGKKSINEIEQRLFERGLTLLK